VHNKKVWQFDFDIESIETITNNNDSTALLKEDAQGVPVIVDLSETPGLDNTINCDEHNANCWFEIICHK
jgi:hypothetical protein